MRIWCREQAEMMMTMTMMTVARGRSFRIPRKWSPRTTTRW